MNKLNHLALTTLIVLALAVAGLAAPVLGESTAPVHGPVATVNGEAISYDDFMSTLQLVAGTQIVDRLVTLTVVLQANRAQKLVTTEEIDREFAKVRAEFKTDDDFIKALRDNGLTPASLRSQMEAKLTLDKLAAKDATASDEEIAGYFKEHETELAQPEEVRARHILVEDEATANKVEEALKAGGDFAKLAGEYSKDPGSKDKGGELGFFRRGELVPEFEKAAFAAKAGETTAPVKTEYGWHIIQVEEHKAAQPANLASAKETIRQTIIKNKTKQTNDVVSELRAKADIKLLWTPTAAVTTATK